MPKAKFKSERIKKQAIDRKFNEINMKKTPEQPANAGTIKSEQEEAGATMAEVEEGIKECERELSEVNKELKENEQDLADGFISQAVADKAKVSLLMHRVEVEKFLREYRHMREQFLDVAKRFKDHQRRAEEFLKNFDSETKH